MAADGDKRTVIISANCHGRFLRRSLGRTPIGEQYEVVWAREMGRLGHDRLPDQAIERCAILLEQIGHETTGLAGAERLPADCQVIRFPIVWLNSLWPMHCADPRSPNNGPEDRGRFPYGDRLILRYLEEGASPEVAVDRWFAADASQMKKLDRYHEINAAKARQLDLDADVKLGAFVLDRFRRERLFVSFNHPTPRMLLHMARQLCEAMGYRDVEPVIPRANAGGIGDIHAPIHPAVAAHFGLEWWGPGDLYRHFEDSLTAREYLLRYAAFAPIGLGAAPAVAAAS